MDSYHRYLYYVGGGTLIGRIDCSEVLKSPCRPVLGFELRNWAAPLQGFWTHQKGGFSHDGRFPDLRAIVEHYNRFLKLNLTEQEKVDLIEYLKSL